MPDAKGTKLGPAHVCRVAPGCFGTIYGHSMCRKHYLQNRRHGNPLHAEVQAAVRNTPFGVLSSDAAYIAGLFDGEGSIYCRATRADKKPHPVLRVVVSNTFRPVLDWIQCVLKHGKIHGYPHPNRHTCYDLILCDCNAERFLHTVMPYIRIKRDRAELALAMRRTIRQHGNMAVGQDTLSERQRIETALRQGGRIA